MSFTATQTDAVEHDMSTPATNPPANTVTGTDHRPDDHDVTTPSSPMTEHALAVAHETAYA
jgi:hypothetical protein